MTTILACIGALALVMVALAALVGAAAWHAIRYRTAAYHHAAHMLAAWLAARGERHGGIVRWRIGAYGVQAYRLNPAARQARQEATRKRANRRRMQAVVLRDAQRAVIEARAVALAMSGRTWLATPRTPRGQAMPIVLTEDFRH